MASSITWGLLLLADLCSQVSGAMRQSSPDIYQYDLPHFSSFAFSLYHELARQSNDKIIFSPVSIAIAFAMLLSLGTKDDTYIQILKGIGFKFKKAPKADIHKGLGSLPETLKQPNSQFQLTASTMLIIDENPKQKPEFLYNVKKLYHSKALSINFRNIKEAKKEINHQIKVRTQGIIVDLVKELDEDMALALVNYIIFEGKWKDKFEAQCFLKGDFHVNEKITVKVPVTNRLGMFHLYRDNEFSCWVLVQHYQGRMAAFLLLPNLGKMQLLEDGLSEKNLAKILKYLEIRSANLHLPKLSISGTYDLKTLLGKLGITKVFSNGADLSGITEEVPLKLSKVSVLSPLWAIHEAVMSINENGTEHAGATLSEESAWSEHLTINFNMPFLIIVKDENTNIPLFMGKVVNPMQK
ncbi:LOW QUALITY PROTEIN: alpha-1-antiproteinase-like [Globicephala melas]|uniref:LOW QUALITY PROTEIN: alpha-1-antiproteinase-like n=1 Tax=Globicephala melas TaxID=9731 RepID=UPI00293D8754|nr:LOW QUALITY PROTEIN: alpha-1-antiproteinase-like [Globicephala melas]